MKKPLPVLLLACMLLLPTASQGEVKESKEHDFIPKVHNLIFIMDVSDSMMRGYPKGFDHSRSFVATRAFQWFNDVMPHVSKWQYDLNTALITFGDCQTPRLVGVLSPWTRVKYGHDYAHLRKETFNPWRTATLQDALQLAGSLMGKAAGRTAIVIFSDGGTGGECPQVTTTAMKKYFGDKLVIYGVYFGNTEVGYRNLYEICKLTGGYCRAWEDVRTKPQMKEFAWDTTVREIMFPYPEIFFAHKTADLLPSEALKLEAVANFLHAIPQYVLQIDGHTDFFGSTTENHKLARDRAENVKKALVNMYKIDPGRILIRSWGEELPRYDNTSPEQRYRNRQANLYLMLPLRNCPYDEKRLHTFGTSAVGHVYNTQERNADDEWAWVPKPPPGDPPGNSAVHPKVGR
ncbi:MAG: OmpA family protein [Thermodesulfobacteriota bacterium]